MKYHRKKLEKQYVAGKKPKFLFFWGHKKHPSGELTSSCLSQWWKQTFIVNAIRYPTAEHWMMAEKARLFNDNKVLAEILKSNSPGYAKSLGRQVRRFKHEVWEEKKFNIVVQGNLNKFSQSEDLKNFLLNTKNRVLVEASPTDKVWGIGLESSNGNASIPTKWRGQNLLGFALMEVRDLLSNK